MDFTPCKSFQRDDLEVTRNPFDSREFDKENLPAFSPSIFVVSASRSSEKKNKSFRWSIDQIAALKPADIDEFPNQEYSTCYDREEDEQAAQNAINEYFSKVTLPSPWMRNKEIAYKRVTFSPNPPTYFKETSYDSNKGSSFTGSQNEDEAKFADCSCQTALTIPPDFDLEKLLGDNLFTYNESEANPTTARELSISTLRRKLFSQGGPPPHKDVSEIDASSHNQRPEVKSASSTPRTPRTPNWVTSSPFREQNVHRTPSNSRDCDDTDSVLQSSFVGDPLNSPLLSPIKDDNGDDIALSFTRIDSPDTSFEFSREQDSVSCDFDLSGNDGKMREHPFDVQRQGNTMSVEPSELVLDVKESTRLALVDLPGFSPIKNDDHMDISVVSSSKYDYDIRYDGNSIKESTANYIHGITELFSPICRSKNPNSFANVNKNALAVTNEIDEVANHSIDDGGPLDLTDLSLPPDQSTFPKVDEEDIDDVSDEVFKPPVVIVSPYPTPKRGILKHKSQRGEPLAEKAVFENRFDDLEQKINHVDCKIESVKSHCESGIREIKRSLTPNAKQSDAFGDGTSCRAIRSKNINVYTSKLSEVSFSQEGFRPFIHMDRRKALEDHTNRNNAQIARGGPFYAVDNNQARDTIVRRGYSALNRAKCVQRKIDEEFNFGLSNISQKKQLPPVDDDDVEAAEIERILKADKAERLERERDNLPYLEGDDHCKLEKKFTDYRLQAVRESLNDSWDLRSKGAMDTVEMDNSVMSPTNFDTTTPTPIKNLEGLSIYNNLKDNVSSFNSMPVAPDRKQVGRIERRHTWPSSKPSRHFSTLNIRSISPPFPSRLRSSKGPFAKQDIVLKIREELKIRPSSRTGFSFMTR